MSSHATAAAPQHKQHVPSAWSALGNPVYRTLWIAGVVSGSGSVVQEVTAGWLMTSLTSSAATVALLHTAMSLPVVFLAVPAGAIADVVNRRRLMIVIQSISAMIALGLGLAVWSGHLSPVALLTGVLLLGALNALHTPAWMRTVPDVLPPPQIPLGVILNSTGVNISRVLGATLGGVLLASSGAAAGFFANAVSFLVLVPALYWWAGPKPVSRLPGEHLAGAMNAGVRYARYSPQLRAVLIRTAVFATCGSAIPALMPVVARHELRLSNIEFGLLTAVFGAGALIGASILNQLRRAISTDNLVAIMSLILAVTAVSLAVVRDLWLLYTILLVGGAAWVTMVATFGVASGSASPEWVLSRALSLYMLCFQGGAALGGILWGQVAQNAGVSTALLAAAAALVLTLLMRFALPLPIANPTRLAPSQHWPAPPAIGEHEQERGPVLVLVQYEVDPSNADSFIAAMQLVRQERLRHGALQWHLFVDPQNPSRYLESFKQERWVDHLRQHERVTLEDHDIETAARIFHIGAEPPVVRHYVARKVAS